MSNNPTIVTYMGNGTQTDFQFTFDYLRKDFVEVLLNGVLNTTFTFPTPYTVRVSPAPAAGVVVIIRRRTDRDRLVNFVDGSVLQANDLNVAQLQAIHISAEALDMTGATLVIDAQGAYSAGFRKIANVADPTNPQDVVNKQWVETTATSQVVAAGAQANIATTQASAAAASATTATNRASAALTSQTAAATSASAAATSATSAAASATTATTQAGIATTKATEAATTVSTVNATALQVYNDATYAAGRATAAATSASQAATSATDANTRASAALTSQNAAGTSATNATTSANAASSSATAAGASATAAATSASNASASAGAASASATSAGTSATNAANSATAAATSATNAANSATSAGTSATNAANSATTAANAASSVDNTRMVPTGTVFWLAHGNTPTGFLLCQGQAVSRTTFSGLFAAIGTIYGVGDGSTTFNVPDLRGTFVRGVDGGRGVDSAGAGRALGSFQTHAMQSHIHSFTSTGATNTGLGGSASRINAVATTGLADVVVTSSNNGNTATETRPSNIAFHGIIKT